MSEIDSLKIVIEAEDRVSGVISGISDNINNLNRSTGNNSKSIKNIGADIKSIGNDIDAVTKPLQYAAVGSVAAGVAVSKAAMDYETAFTKVKKTVNASDEEFKQIDADIKKLSSDIPVNAAELANLAGVGGQLGVGAKDITKFTRVMADMSVATNLAGENGAAALARLINVTGESMDNVDRVGSSIVALGNNTATTEAEIAEMAQRMGKFGNTVGMNISQVLGYSAALSSMGVEAQAGGSAMGRVWLQIEKDIANNTEYLHTYAKYAGTTADEFKKKWNTDPSGAFNGLIKGLSATEDLTVALGEMGIENTLDQQAVIALANNYEMLEKCLNLSSEAYQQNTALTKEATTAYGTARNQIKMALNEITTAAVKWGDILLPEIKSGAEWVGNIAQKFGDLDAGTKNAVISGAKAAIVMGGVSKATAATVKGVGGFLEGVSNIKKSVAPGGALFKLAPTLTKAAAAAGPVALGIAGVGAAVLVAKGIYDSYVQSQLNWSEGLSESAEKVTEVRGKIEEIGSLQKELQTLKLKVSSDNSSKEEIETAKNRISEIAQILKEKYNLDISIDNTKLDDTIEKLDTAITKTKELNLADGGFKASELGLDLSEKVDEYNSVPETITDLEKEIASKEAILTKYNNILTLKNEIEDDFQDTLDEYREATGKNMVTNDQEQFKSLSFEKYEKLNELLKDTDYYIENLDKKNVGDVYRQLIQLANEADKIRTEVDPNNGTLRDELETLQNSITEFEKSRGELINYGLTELQYGDEAQGIKILTDATKNYGASALDTGMKVAAVKSEMSSFSELAGKSPEAFQKAVADYQNAAKEFGASGEEIAIGSALIESGFDNVKQAANAGMLEGISKRATELARSVGDIPETKSISINAEGDISVIDDVTGRIENIKNERVDISINANGDLSVVDEATGKIQTLSGIGAVNLQVNAEGDIEVLDAAQQKIATIDGESGVITVNAEYPNAAEIEKAIQDKQKLDDKDVQLKATGSYPGKGEIAQAIDDYNNLKDKYVTYTVAYKTAGIPPIENAKGTQNFSGGLAMVNDETGVSDPRELIIDKGRAFIPQGKNVILPLSKGAKVYTASQTKRIMSGLGIPHYASGKDNSDAFISAKDDWTHYTKTHAVTVTEELSKWNAFSKQFTSNLKDAADIEEQIFSLIQKTRTEQNEASEAYIMNRAEMNDWEAWGDSAIDAFSRVRKREYEYVEAGKITIEAADKYLISLGENMYQKRIANSKEWLDREVEYHNMNTEQYMAGLDRMEAYTKEYYANGILAGEEYYKGMQELAYMRIDKEREENNRIYDDWKNSAEGYKEQRDLYGDWNEFGDSPIQFYERCKERQKEFFEQGIIDWETYNAAIIDYDMELYKAQSNALDDMLDAQSKYIDEVSSKYDDMIDKLDYEYEMKNLRLDLTDAVKNESIYKGAVTQKGKDKYTEYSKQIDELGHQIEMKTLQKEQNDTVAALRADYEVMEKGKSLALKGLNAQCIDIDALTRTISGNTSSMQSLVEDIVDLIRNLDVGNKVTYGNTTLNIDAGDADISSFIKRATNALGG